MTTKKKQDQQHPLAENFNSTKARHHAVHQMGYVSEELNGLESALVSISNQIMTIDAAIITRGLSVQVDLVSGKLNELQRTLDNTCTLLDQPDDFNWDRQHLCPLNQPG